VGVTRRHGAHESGMIARREERGRSTVSRTSTKEERFAYGGNFTDPEIGVDKVPAGKVGTVGSGIGRWAHGGGRGGGEWGDSKWKRGLG
jgi:hypothetical protein